MALGVEENGRRAVIRLVRAHSHAMRAQLRWAWSAGRADAGCCCLRRSSASSRRCCSCSCQQAASQTHRDHGNVERDRLLTEQSVREEYPPAYTGSNRCIACGIRRLHNSTYDSAWTVRESLVDLRLRYPVDADWSQHWAFAPCLQEKELVAKAQNGADVVLHLIAARLSSLRVTEERGGTLLDSYSVVALSQQLDKVLEERLRLHLHPHTPSAPRQTASWRCAHTRRCTARAGGQGCGSHKRQLHSSHGTRALYIPPAPRSLGRCKARVSASPTRSCRLCASQPCPPARAVQHGRHEQLAPDHSKLPFDTFLKLRPTVTKCTTNCWGLLCVCCSSACFVPCAVESTIIIWTNVFPLKPLECLLAVRSK